MGSVLLIVFWSGADWSHFGARSPIHDGVHALAHRRRRRHGHAAVVRATGCARPAGRARGRLPTARADLTVSFSLVFFFCLSMIFLATQIDWTGQILDEGPRLCLLLADRIGAEIGPIGRAVFLMGFWGAAFGSVLGVWHGVPFLFDDWLHLWRREPPTGQQGTAYRVLGRLSDAGGDLGARSSGGRCGSCSPTPWWARCSSRS